MVIILQGLCLYHHKISQNQTSRVRKKWERPLKRNLSQFYSSQSPHCPRHSSSHRKETVDPSHHPYSAALVLITERRVRMICCRVVEPRKGEDLMAVYCSGSKQRAPPGCLWSIFLAKSSDSSLLQEHIWSSAAAPPYIIVVGRGQPQHVNRKRRSLLVFFKM